MRYLSKDKFTEIVEGSGKVKIILNSKDEHYCLMLVLNDVTTIANPNWNIKKDESWFQSWLTDENTEKQVINQN